MVPLAKTESRNKSSRKRLESCLEYGAEIEPTCDMQLLRELHQNRQKYEATKDTLSKLAG